MVKVGHFNIDRDKQVKSPMWMEKFLDNPL